MSFGGIDVSRLTADETWSMKAWKRGDWLQANSGDLSRFGNRAPKVAVIGRDHRIKLQTGQLYSRDFAKNSVQDLTCDHTNNGHCLFLAPSASEEYPKFSALWRKLFLGNKGGTTFNDPDPLQRF